jgi:hypothetical protein
MTDDRGQLDYGGYGRLMAGILIAAAVAVLVGIELVSNVGEQLQGQRVTEVGGPWLDPGMAVVFLALNAALVLGVHLMERRNPNSDR